MLKIQGAVQYYCFLSRLLRARDGWMCISITFAVRGMLRSEYWVPLRFLGDETYASFLPVTFSLQTSCVGGGMACSIL